MVNIIHRIGIKASPASVYDAIATIKGLSSWWTTEVEGGEQKGSRIRFVFRTLSGEVKGSMEMQVEQLVPGKEVRWQCVDGPAEWIGTSISFELSTEDDQTIVIFGHRNW